MLNCSICHGEIKSVTCEESSKIAVGPVEHVLTGQPMALITLQWQSYAGGPVCWSCIGEAFRRYGEGLKTRQ